MKTGNLLVRILLLIVFVYLVQLISINYVPNIIFQIAKIKSGKPLNTVIHAPKTDASLRKVVLPNPDFIYSACFFDVRDNDLLITGVFPDTSQYCSLAFYGNDVQPFYVINNLQGFKANYKVRLSGVGRVNGCIKSASKQGVVLMRILATDSSQTGNALNIQSKFKVEIRSQNE
ncbi:MAG: DUF1254 domain-containing protein [Chitinophagales bacterium]